ncbi:MAG: DNA polymerase III subunit delta' [Clostridia bacterium]|nr:DNA polymerase III subunit delta' [Clostridia bacterium]
MGLAFSDFEGQSVHIGRLQEEFGSRTFTHAYLFIGPAGTGKRSVARLCAQAALCRGEQKPCGVCGPCKRVLAETHPDFHIMTPADGKREISVGQMRELIHEAEVHSFEDGVKVFFIPEAEKMNTAAQNALLKTLEEPTSQTVFILCTVHASALLPTIVSRCRVIRFHPLTQEQTENRLRALGMEESQIAIRAQMAEGCVGQALALEKETISLRNTLAEQFFSVHTYSDMVSVVNTYKDDKENRQKILDLLEDIVREILCVQAGVRSAVVLPGEAERYAGTVPAQGGLALQEKIIEAKKMIKSNVSYQSALELILIKISEEYSRWPW